MQAGIIVFAVIICMMSGFGVYAPGRLVELVMPVWEKKGSLYFAVIIRLVLGVLLILVAHDTKFPVAFQALGCVALVVAIIIPFTGRERLTRFIDWCSKRPPVVVRLWCLLGIAFGGFLLYGVW